MLLSLTLTGYVSAAIYTYGISTRVSGGMWFHLHAEAARLNRLHLETSIILITNVFPRAMPRARAAHPPRAHEQPCIVRKAD